MPNRYLYVVAYDITDPKRLRRIHKVVKSYATGSQKSAFECFLTASEPSELISKSRSIIEETEDRLALIPVGTSTQLAQLYFDFIDRTDWEEIYGIWSVATRVRARRISEWRVERHSPNCLWSLVLCGKSIPNEKNSANYVNYINASIQ